MSKEIDKVLEVLFDLKSDKFYFESYGRDLIQGLIDSKWISVETELPKEEGWYIACRESCTEANYYGWNGERWFNKGTSDLYFIADITHWQPLPKPPITKKRGGCNP